MKVGDLVMRKDQGISLAEAKKYLGRVGIITHITHMRHTADFNRILVMFDNDFGVFLEQYLEVISEAC